jgi:hypothetical protein
LNLGLRPCKAHALCLSHTSSPFFSGYFGDRILRTICLGWPWTSIFPISASQVARITSVHHWSPDHYIFCEDIFEHLILW